MAAKNSGERQIVWWNLITMVLMTGLSFVIINTDGGYIFYGLVAALFLCAGVLIKRPYVFIGILILTLVFVFVAKDGFFGNFDFDLFINSNK